MTAPRVQCAKCPWKTSTDPNEITDGYCSAAHRDLTDTIAEEGSLVGLVTPIRIMACHESPVGAELPCVGWLSHQIGPGNNLPLRLRVMTGNVDGNIQTVGPQHKTLEATFP